MDISNLTNAYGDLYASQARNTKLQGTLQGDFDQADEKELMDACKQFEAYFLEQVFKEMKKTVPQTTEGSNATLMEYMEDQYIQQIAADSTEKNSLGLAQMLFEQMKRNYGMDPTVVQNPEE